MKIAITSTGSELHSPVEMRFGRSAGFMVCDENKEAMWNYIDNIQNYDSAQGAGIQSAGTIIDAGVNVVISGNVGPKAFQMLHSSNVDVYLVGEMPVEEAYQLFKDEKLTKSESANVDGHW